MCVCVHVHVHVYVSHVLVGWCLEHRMGYCVSDTVISKYYYKCLELTFSCSLGHNLLNNAYLLSQNTYLPLSHQRWPEGAEKK